MITSFGYPLETYSNLETEDGYILDMQRIPHGKLDYDKANEKREPILLLHPMLTSGEMYTFGEQSIAFMLADLGYDVWIPNFRGSLYSRKHKHLPIQYNSTYWDYS